LPRLREQLSSNPEPRWTTLPGFARSQIRDLSPATLAPVPDATIGGLAKSHKNLRNSTRRGPFRAAPTRWQRSRAAASELALCEPAG